MLKPNFEEADGLGKSFNVSKFQNFKCQIEYVKSIDKSRQKFIMLNMRKQISIEKFILLFILLPKQFLSTHQWPEKSHFAALSFEKSVFM